VKGKLNLVDVGVASIGAYVEPSMGLNYQFGLLDSSPGFDQSAFLLWGVTVGAEVTVGWWTFNLGEMEWGPWQWPDQGGNLVQAPQVTGSSQLGVLAQPDIVALPDGRLLLAYAQEEELTGDSEVVYQVRGLAGDWSAPVSVSDDPDHPDQAVRLGLRPDGTVTAVWSHVGLTAAELATASADEVMAAQEIYHADFDGTSWTTPAALTGNAFGDGNAAVAYGSDGKGLAMWVEDGGTFSDGTDDEIAYSAWNGATWSAPATLTANAVGDRGVDIAYAGTSAMAVWVQDVDADNLQRKCQYATWDGAGWSGPADVPGAPIGDIHSVQAVRLTDGRVVVVWSEAADDGSVLLSAVRSASGAWSPVETAADEVPFVDGLRLAANSADTVFAYFHGYQGTEEILHISRDFSNPFAGWTTPLPATNGDPAEWMPAGTIDSNGDLFLVYANEPEGGTPLAPTAGQAGGAGSVGPLGTVTVPGGVNLTATGGSLGLLDPSTVAGENAALSVNVRNSGTLTSPATTVQFYLGDPGAGGTPIGSAAPLASLVPDGKAVVTSSYFALPSGTNSYYAAIEPVAGEVNDADNTISADIQSRSPDITPPQATVEVSPSGLVPGTAWELTVDFGEPVTAVSESDFSLIEASLGMVVPDHVHLSPDGKTATLIVEGGLRLSGDATSYALTVLDTVRDMAGNALDGDGDGAAGGDWVSGPIRVALFGDANLDGEVGVADLSAVADNYGTDTGATWTMGDFNRDGEVGIADLSAVADHYGEDLIPGGDTPAAGAAAPAAQSAPPPAAGEDVLTESAAVAGVKVAPMLPTPAGFATSVPGIAVDPVPATPLAWLAGDPIPADDTPADLLAGPDLAVLPHVL